MGDPMNIQATVTNAVRGFVDTAKRSAIAYAVCAVCGLAAVILGTSAAIMALIPVVGAVYAQLIVASVFLMVIVATMLWLQRPAPKAKEQAVPVGASAAADPASRSQTQFAQIAMIIEAVMLGYSMSRRR